MAKKKITTKFIAIIAVVLIIIVAKGLLETRKNQIANETLPVLGSVTVPVVTAKQGSMQNRKSIGRRGTESKKGRGACTY